MVDDLTTRFEQAAKDVMTLSAAPDIPTKLKLYALYKQGSLGDCTGERPGGFDFAGIAKFDAWKELSGMTKEAAMESYVKLVAELRAADGSA